MRSWIRGVDLFVNGRRRLRSVAGRERKDPIVGGYAQRRVAAERETLAVGIFEAVYVQGRICRRRTRSRACDSTGLEFVWQSWAKRDCGMLRPVVGDVRR